MITDFVPPDLAPRNPRFARQPSELCQLAGVWKPGQTVAGFTAEEKIDGVRAIWFDGTLWSREGVPYDLPHVTAELGGWRSASASGWCWTVSIRSRAAIWTR